MNRAVPAAIMTAIGLGALASFKSSPGLPTKTAGAVVAPRTTVPPSTAPPRRRATTTTAPSAPAPHSTTPATTGATAPATNAPTTPATTGQTRTLTGDPVDSQYGTVQVQVAVRGNQILDVVALQMPDSHRRSIEISQAAEPILRQEALQAQSAQIDIVSGATFTSESYAQSLQSALARA